VEYAGKKLHPFGTRATLINANYADMGDIAPQHGFTNVDGITMDLGLSSRQLDTAERGFSFMRNGLLDMRFDTNKGQSAADLINNLPEAELADIFYKYGEERRSRRIAKAIVAARPIQTTGELADLIAGTVRRQGRKHPATLVFQALRIAVNQELASLEKGLPAAINLLKTGGRLAIISFHSLEDRFVKQSFRELAKDCICPPRQPICTCNHQPTVRLITRKVVKPSAQEEKDNPRSRSARLRVVEKLKAK
jgi:16S rRNA (cytosine1402-N4)-methyltransferase